MDFKPLIAVIPSISDSGAAYYVRQNYLDMISMAGGIPIVMPWKGEAADINYILSRCDGLLLTGGEDVNPAAYGEWVLPQCGLITPERDDCERIAVNAALGADMPIFGICRGIQSLNVILGGALYQDLPSQLSPDCAMHSQSAPYEAPAHNVDVVAGTPLYDLWNVESIAVNSSHHQAIKRCAEGFKAMAFAPQGFVEAVYMPDRDFVWAVQWHPEYMVEPQADAAIRGPQLALLRRFTAAAKRYGIARTAGEVSF